MCSKEPSLSETVAETIVRGDDTAAEAMCAILRGDGPAVGVAIAKLTWHGLQRSITEGLLLGSHHSPDTDCIYIISMGDLIVLCAISGMQVGALR